MTPQDDADRKLVEEARTTVPDHLPDDALSYRARLTKRLLVALSRRIGAAGGGGGGGGRRNDSVDGAGLAPWRQLGGTMPITDGSGIWYEPVGGPGGPSRSGGGPGRAVNTAPSAAGGPALPVGMGTAGSTNTRPFPVGVSREEIAEIARRWIYLTPHNGPDHLCQGIAADVLALLNPGGRL